MTTTRKTVLSLLAVLLILIAAVALLPLLLRDTIEARVKQAIAANVNARVDWRRADVALLRTFPNLSLQLHDLTVVGIDRFSKDTLLAVPRLRLMVDLGSALGSWRGERPLSIRSVAVRQPRLRLLVLGDGTANWQIMREQQRTDEAGRSVQVSLKQLSIRDGAVTLDNQRTNSALRVAGLTHDLSGDFSEQQFRIRTHTEADSASLRFAGVPYLSNAELAADIVLAADMANRTFTLLDNQVRLNNLELHAAGTVAEVDDDVALNLAFKTPRTRFGDILSLVPAVYQQDFRSVQTTGTMSVTGRVRGRLGKTSFPAFAVRAHVDNASFRYPDLPLPARDIFFRLSLNNPGGSPDHTVLNIDRLHARLGTDPIDGAFALRTPISDPDVALRLTGRVDLANIPRTIKLESVQQLAGVVVTNAALRARMSDVNQKRYDRVSANGKLDVRQLTLRAAGLRQPLDIAEAVLTFTPQHAELTSFRARAGSSDIAMKGSLENVIGFMLGREPLRGDATVASRRFDLNEWRSEDEMKAVVVPPNIDFVMRATVDTVKYGDLTLRNARGALRIRDQRVALEDFRMDVFGGALQVTGFYETVPAAAPRFDVAVDAQKVDAAAAFTGLRTVQAFAPVARYADGDVTAQVKLSGELGANMFPVLTQLSGLGSVLTSGLVLRNFPPLNGLADALKLQQLRDPGFVDLKSSFAIQQGRLHVRPFDVRTGPLSMTVAGSNGIDQSLDYTLALQLPRSVLGGEVNRAVSGIINRSQQVGFNLANAESVTLGVKLGGTITKPTVATSFRDAAGDAGASVAKALREEAERRQQAVLEQVDSAADAARQRAIAEAESRAAAIRAEAAALAESLRSEGYARADSLEARATGVARIAAKAAADRLRKETDSKANTLVREADERAAALVAETRKRAQLTEQP